MIQLATAKEERARVAAATVRRMIAKRGWTDKIEKEARLRVAFGLATPWQTRGV